jgi:hypothetical protein
MDGENDHFRKPQSRIVISDGQPQALRKVVNALDPISKAP